MFPYRHLLKIITQNIRSFLKNVKNLFKKIPNYFYKKAKNAVIIGVVT